MKNWFKKLGIPTGEQKELVAYNSWVVRWTSRYGEYRSDENQEAEIFPSEDDANEFANQLKEAFKLLRYKNEVTYVSVKANQNKMASLAK